MDKKKITLLTTGGTISGCGRTKLDLKDYKPGALTGEELLERVPEIRTVAEVDILQMTSFGSTSITSAHWVALQQKVQKLLQQSDCDGIVITHGTNTLEETAYFLHLTINSEKPVVLVGAQRPFSALGSDAPLNLLQAFRVAAAPASKGKGVLVVLNDEINGAREVTKKNTYRVEAFQSGQLGLLGYIDPDHSVQFYRSPTRKHTIHSQFSKLYLEHLPSVAILYSYAGADKELIQFVARSGLYKGIVIAGTGGGHCSLGEKEGIDEALDQGLCVVRSSRTGDGRVVMLERDHWKRCVTGDNLLPQKARILLMLSLLETEDRERIQQFFNEY